MEPRDIIILAKSSLILKELVNTIPRYWFCMFSAKHFSLKINESQPSIMFTIIVGFCELQVVIVQRTDCLFTIEISSSDTVIAHANNILFKDLGKKLMSII